MLIVACQKCGEMKVLAGSPDAAGIARAVWTCSNCGAGQVMELAISKDARRGDLRRIVAGMALARSGDLSKKAAAYQSLSPDNSEGSSYDEE